MGLLDENRMFYLMRTVKKAIEIILPPYVCVLKFYISTARELNQIQRDFLNDLLLDFLRSVTISQI